MDYKYIQNNNNTSLLLLVIFVYIKLTDFIRFDVVCQETVHCPEAGKGEGEGGITLLHGKHVSTSRVVVTEMVILSCLCRPNPLS